MSNVKKYLAGILLQEYGEEKLNMLVDACKTGRLAKDEEMEALMIDLILVRTPRIHVNGRPIAAYYQSEPKDSGD